MLMVTVFDSSDILLLIGTVAPTKHWVIYIDLWLPWLYIYIYQPLRVFAPFIVLESYLGAPAPIKGYQVHRLTNY